MIAIYSDQRSSDSLTQIFAMVLAMSCRYLDIVGAGAISCRFPDYPKVTETF
jgi:hypothetical protein